MMHNGKRLLKTREDFESWAREVPGAWAGDALEDATAARELMLQHPPAEYPSVVVWKGVRTFDYWYVERSDLGGPTERAIRAKIAAHLSYCQSLECDNAERLQLEEQVDLMRWILGEISDPEAVPSIFQPKTPLLRKIAEELGEVVYLEEEHGH